MKKELLEVEISKYLSGIKKLCVQLGPRFEILVQGVALLQSSNVQDTSIPSFLSDTFIMVPTSYR